MAANSDAYTRDEMMLLGANSLPVRGEVCPKCGVHIPQFSDLLEKDERRVRQLIRGGRKAEATRELEAATRCPLSFAKIWVLHSGRADAVGTTAPCPHCGKPLKTALAKQCPHCNMDWHNPDKPKKLGKA